MDWKTKFYEGEFNEAVKDLEKEKRVDRSKMWSFRELQILRDMARENIIPTGNFGDNDYCVWSMFRQMMN